MIDVFEDTPEEKEQYIVDMIQKGYTYKDIMRERHVSPSTISKVRKARFGSFEDQLEKTVEISKETQAIRLFNEGKSPIQIAIELDLATDFVLVIHERYQSLRNLGWFNSSFEQVKGNIGPYLQLFSLMNSLGMTPEQVAEQVKYGNNLPQLQSTHLTLRNEINELQSQKQNLCYQLNLVRNEVDNCAKSLEYFNNEIAMRKYEQVGLDYEIDKKKKIIQNLDNDPGYVRIRKAAEEQTNFVIQNNSILILVSNSATLEALRRYPDYQQLIFDLLASQNSTELYQQSWISSHGHQLFQPTQQVQKEITEQVARMGIDDIHATQSESDNHK
jgi:hypothetical protein